MYKKEIDKILSGETKFIRSDHPLINNIDFLKELEETYSKLEHYEVASIINDRITILSSTKSLHKELDKLNNKIKLAKFKS